MDPLMQFWSEMPSRRQEEYVHPRDREALALIDNHIFDLQALPCNFQGAIRTAQIVLLFLSPGFNETADCAEASEHFDRYLAALKGNAPIAQRLHKPALSALVEVEDKVFQPA